jgi:lycopene beta-cyclase
MVMMYAVLRAYVNDGRFSNRRPSAWLFLAYLASLPVYCLARVTGDVTLIGGSTAITCASWFFCALTHCNESVASARTGMMLFSGFAIAWLFEHLGSQFGFLFGNYSYTDLLGIKLGGVPIIIPVAWFMMLYPAWVTAGFLTRNTHGVIGALVRIVLGAGAMTAWDLSLDPRWVADGAWVWHNGGAYFGIPLSNFAGWFVTAALIFAVWHLLPANRQAGPQPAGPLALWIYIITWLGESVANLLFWSGPLIALIVFSAMGIFGLPVLIAEIRRLRSN